MTESSESIIVLATACCWVLDSEESLSSDTTGEEPIYRFVRKSCPRSPLGSCITNTVSSEATGAELNTGSFTGTTGLTMGFVRAPEFTALTML